MEGCRHLRAARNHLYSEGYDVFLVMASCGAGESARPVGVDLVADDVELHVLLGQADLASTVCGLRRVKDH